MNNDVSEKTSSGSSSHSHRHRHSSHRSRSDRRYEKKYLNQRRIYSQRKRLKLTKEDKKRERRLFLKFVIAMIITIFFFIFVTNYFNNLVMEV